MHALPYFTLDRDAGLLPRADVAALTLGGNFGVVTSFEFQLHPVGPEVYAGLVVYPFAQAQKVLRAWRDFTTSSPDELSVWTVMRKAPPLPFLPASAHGTDVVIFALVYCGDVEAGRRTAAPVLQLGGAMARVAPTATAFAGRDARYIMNVHGRWSDARDDERVRAWTRKVFQDAAPHATGGGYVNFLTDDEAERVAASYGVNHARLQAVKQRYDPGNLFRMNLNIAPVMA